MYDIAAGLIVFARYRRHPRVLVEKRYVVPGQLEDDNLRVILEGLEPDDSVIVEGLQRARPGMPVTAEGA